MLARRRNAETRRAIRWNVALKFVAFAALSSLAAKSILVVPDGEAAVRISQLSGVRPGTLYAGTHLLVPLSSTRSSTTFAKSFLHGRHGRRPRQRLRSSLR